MPPRKPIVPGERFGRLVVQCATGNGGLEVCLCDCGTTKAIQRIYLQDGRVQSCGCYRRECGQAKRTHGMHGTVEYRAWVGMIQRCTNPRTKSWPRYGERGIVVCDRWRESFVAFYEDMGPRPGPEYSIDRIDNDGNYEPGNCRWATKKQQGRNKRNNRIVVFNGQTKTLAEWAQEMRTSPSTLHIRLERRGWSVEKTLTTPVRKLVYKRNH